MSKSFIMEKKVQRLNLGQGGVESSDSKRVYLEWNND